MPVIPMKCTSCGGALEVGPEMESFSCGYCGTPLQVERKGGTVALKMVAEGLRAVQAGTDKTAAELALKRLDGELAAVRRQMAEIMQDRRPVEKMSLMFYLLGSAALFIMLVGLIAGVFWWGLLPGGGFLMFLGYFSWPSLNRTAKRLAPLKDQEKSILREIEKNKAIVRS